MDRQRDGQMYGWRDRWMEMDGHRKGWTGCLRWGGFELIDCCNGGQKRKLSRHYHNPEGHLTPQRQIYLGYQLSDC